MRRCPRTVSLIALAALGAGACHIKRSAPPTTTITETAQAVDREAAPPATPSTAKPEQPAEPAPEPPPPPSPAKPKSPRGVAMKIASGSGSGHGVVGGPAVARPMPAPDTVSSTEDYRHYDANRMTLVKDDRLSTFAVDVDTASYAIVRRKILEGQGVPADAVSVEEFLNYFKYGYEGPGDERPFAVHMEAAPSPFTSGRHLLRIGIQGRTVPRSQRKRADLVFLVDVSGSMQSPDKLPLAQRSLRILVDNLDERDTVALVTYDPGRQRRARGARRARRPRRPGHRDRPRALTPPGGISCAPWPSLCACWSPTTSRTSGASSPPSSRATGMTCCRPPTAPTRWR